MNPQPTPENAPAWTPCSLTEEEKSVCAKLTGVSAAYWWTKLSETDRQRVELMNPAVAFKHAFVLGYQLGEAHAPQPSAEAGKLADWLDGKVTQTEKSLRGRREMADTSRSGSQAQWDAAAKMHGGKRTTKEERLKEAEGHERIALKIEAELAMYRQAAAALRARDSAGELLDFLAEQVVRKYAVSITADPKAGTVQIYSGGPQIACENNLRLALRAARAATKEEGAS